MTKKKGVFKTIVAVLLSLFCLSAFSTLIPKREKVETRTVNEQVESASGAFYLKLNSETELQVSEEREETLLGSEKTETLTIDGGTIHVTGSNTGVIEAANDGMLVFKNTTIKDKTVNDASAAYNNYINFGGKLRFENCTVDSIYLKNDVNAEFVNCTFVSCVSRWYSVWVADGTVSFEGCTFTGYRGLKIHEFSYSNLPDDDVLSVRVNNCTFQSITEKVGVAIGTFQIEPTAIRLTNNRFIDCQQWDCIGSIEGIDGIYEADMETSELDFTQENNAVEYTGLTRKIKYVAYDMGFDYEEVPSELWKENGNYPTEYTVGKEKKIDSLASVGETEFYGWYLDRACKIAFDGTITSDMDEPITLYAKVMIGSYWTDFY